MKNNISKFAALAVFLFGSAVNVFAQEIQKTEISSILEVQQYSRAIHIMAMLLIGFGFLMVFVKKYGRSALTATFLLVSVSIPMYMRLKELVFLNIRQKLNNLFLLNLELQVC